MTRIVAAPRVWLIAGLLLRSPGATANGEEAFPNPAQLDALGPGPAISDVLNSPLTDVDQWKLEGPFPEQVGVTPHPPGNDFERVLEDAVSKRPGLATSSEAMHCAAREIGRFVLAKNSLPASGLMEFIAARCGALGAGVRPGTLQATVPAGATDAEVLGAWRGGLEELVQKSLAGGSIAAGLWFGREGDRAVAVVASGERPALIEPFSPVARDGAVAIQGEVLEGTDDLTGLVNRGRYGFAECTRDATLALPRFGFRCELAAGDDVAMIELAARPRGRVLTRMILRAMARRPGAEALEYRRAALAGASADDAKDLPAAVLALVNGVRKQAELPPLTLSITQSEQASVLAPHLFAAGIGLEPPAMGDLAALGLAAGWRVGGAIKDVAMTSGYTPGSRDAGGWVDTVLRYPGGRQALLGARGSVLAIGAVSSQTPPLLAAVATTYELFGKEDFAADAAHVVARISAARKAGSPPLKGLPAPVKALLEEAAHALPSGRLTPEAALQQAVTGSGEALHRPLRGLVLQAPSLDALPIPPELLAEDASELSVAIGYYQAPDAPWGRYVALIVVAAPAREQEVEI
jgi:hypothetical protein